MGSQSSRPSMLNTGRMKMVEEQAEKEEEEDIDKILGEESEKIDIQEGTGFLAGLRTEK
jgi:hypothetical protein